MQGWMADVKILKAPDHAVILNGNCPNIIYCQGLLKL